MNHKRIFTIFVILLLMAMVPFKFTSSVEPLVLGWLPFSLLYWWGLMFANLIFVLWVAREFVRTEGKDDNR